MLAELGFDPIAEAVARYRDPKTPNASKDFMMKCVLDRYMPTLRSVEVTGDGLSEVKNILINVLGAPVIEAQTVLPSPVRDALIEEVVLDEALRDED